MEFVVSDVPAAAAADRIARRLSDAVRRRGQASLALSGGSTAPSMIAALVATPAPWPLIDVWQVDERVVADDDPARNARQLRPLLGVARTVCPMPVTDHDVHDVEGAARRYGETLPAQFDVVHLGLGADGHTASWPPDEPHVRTSKRPVELVGLFNGHPRMTLTRRVVNGARARIVLATGAAKRPVVERWLLGDRSLPITAIRRSSTFVYLDESAAPAVTLH